MASLGRWVLAQARKRHSLRRNARANAKQASTASTVPSATARNRALPAVGELPVLLTVPAAAHVTPGTSAQLVAPARGSRCAVERRPTALASRVLPCCRRQGGTQRRKQATSRLEQARSPARWVHTAQATGGDTLALRGGSATKLGSATAAAAAAVSWGGFAPRVLLETTHRSSGLSPAPMPRCLINSREGKTLALPVEPPSAISMPPTSPVASPSPRPSPSGSGRQARCLCLVRLSVQTGTPSSHTAPRW